MYPLLLAATSKLTGLKVLKCGALLNTFLIFVLGCAFAYILKILKFHKYILWSFPLLLLISVPNAVSLWFWSELPCIVFLMFAFLFLLKWHLKKRENALVVAGFFCSLMFLTRYAAVGFVGAFGLFIIWSTRATFVKHIKNIVKFSLPIITGVLCWIVYTKLQKVVAVNRDVVFHPISKRTVIHFFEDISSWFVAGNISLFFFLLFIVTTIIFIIRNSELLGLKYRISVIVLLVLLMSIYMAFLVFSISFLDKMTPLDTRILSPIVPFLWLLFAYLIDQMYQKKFQFRAIVLMSLIACVSMASFPHWKKHFNEGSGYTGLASDKYKNLIKNEFHHNKHAIIYTNSVDLVRFYLGAQHDLRDLPFLYNPFSTLKNKNYEQDLSSLFNALKEKKAQVLYIEDYSWKHYYSTREALLKYATKVPTTFFTEGFMMAE